jgi:CRP/FNR family transcriptional regulator, cyclic AMP receptor protein
MANIDILKKASLLAGLTDGQLKSLDSCGETRKLAQDEVVFEEGALGDEVFVLLDGRVQITMEMSRKTEQAPVHTVLPGSVFGEFALATSAKRSATAVGLKDSSVFVISRDAFEQLAAKDPALGYRVMQNLSEILVGRIIKTTRELRASLMF